MLNRARVFYRRYIKRHSYGWSGDYAGWEQARQHCTGYDADEILAKVKASALKVKRGEAVYERDSVLFDEVQYSWPLLSALLWAAAKNSGRLNVVDFGGSLGTTYFQNKKFLDRLPQVSWNVIEQDKFVTTGREHMQDDRLRFYFDLDESITAQGRPDLLVVSGALEYIEHPYALIDRLASYLIPHVIVENMPFSFEGRDRITVQKVPAFIYTASYPCWFLDYPKVIARFGPRYSLVSEHLNENRIELDGRPVQYQGFLLELKA